jgi:hypothetical protein
MSLHFDLSHRTGGLGVMRTIVSGQSVALELRKIDVHRISQHLQLP